MQAIQDQQEVMGAIADMTIETYAMESAVLRAQKLVEAKGEKTLGLPIAMTRVYLTQAMEKVEAAAKRVIAAVAEGDMLRTQLAILRRLAKYEPFNTIELRQQIAQRAIEVGSIRWRNRLFTTETQRHREQTAPPSKRPVGATLAWGFSHWRVVGIHSQPVESSPLSQSLSKIYGWVRL